MHAYIQEHIQHASSEPSQHCALWRGVAAPTEQPASIAHFPARRRGGGGGGGEGEFSVQAITGQDKTAESSAKRKMQ